MTGRPGVRPGQGAASGRRSCPGHGGGSCWGPAGEAEAGRPRRPAGAGCVPEREPLASCDRGSGSGRPGRLPASCTRATPAQSRARGARWREGARPSRAGSVPADPRASPSGAAGSGRALSLVLTAGRLRAGEAERPPPFPGRPPPPPPHALRGSRCSSPAFLALPVSTALGFGVRPKLLVLINSATWGQVP